MSPFTDEDRALSTTTRTPPTPESKPPPAPSPPDAPPPFPPAAELGELLGDLERARVAIDRRNAEELARLRAIQDRD